MGAILRALGRWLLAGWIMVLSVGWIVSYALFPELVLPFGLAEIMFLVVGGVLAVRVRGNLIGPVLVIGASFGLLYDVGTACAAYSLDRVTPLPLEHFAAWVGAWTGPLSYLMIPALLVLFPDGRFLGRRKWFLLPFGLIVGVVLVGAALIWDVPTWALVDQVGDGALDDYPGYEWVGSSFLPSVVLGIPAAVSLFIRFRRGSALERQQIRWLLASVVAIPVVWLLGYLVVPEEANLDFLISGIPLVALPLSIGVAVLRYRLYDLGRVVSRSITYSLLVGLLGAAVFLVAAVAGSQFDDPWVVAATTLGVAAVFNPLRRRVQVWVDRRFNRSRYDTERVATEFAGSLRDRVEPEAVVGGWLGVVTETMEPSAVGVWVRQ